MPSHCKDIAMLNTLFTGLRYHVYKVTVRTAFFTLYTMNSTFAAFLTVPR